MDVTYLVRFKGLPEKSGGALEKMIRKDVAGYLLRMNMESVVVEKAGVIAAVRQEKKNAKS